VSKGFAAGHDDDVFPRVAGMLMSGLGLAIFEDDSHSIL